MALTDILHPSDVSLNTDLYELTMAQGFFEAGMLEHEATFTAYFRDAPFKGGYAICAGVGQIADLVKNFTFDDDKIAYLASLPAPNGGKLFTLKFLEWLSSHKLKLDIWAVPEGDVVFPREPLVRVSGPIIDCQLIETALLNLINFQTLTATKCARVVRAAEGRPVADFGLRRAQGHDGGLAVARASYIAGASSTSNMLAGKLYGIPVFGTHAHSWVMAFPDELTAFRAFATSQPKNCTLLIDTYDVSQGIEHAIIVAKEMEAAGAKLMAVRLDSGDLAKLSKLARRRFDEEGLSYVQISVSNDLDEYTVQSLLSQGAPIDSFGVGTKLATCDPQPALGGVYKLTATRDSKDAAWRPVIKLSEQLYKRTIPGVLNVKRYIDEQGCPVGDVIYDKDYEQAGSSVAVDVIDAYQSYTLSGTPHELLVEVVHAGEPTDYDTSIERARARCKDALMHLDPAITRFLNPQVYPVGLELGLAQLRHDLASEQLRLDHMN